MHRDVPRILTLNGGEDPAPELRVDHGERRLLAGGPVHQPSVSVVLADVAQRFGPGERLRENPEDVRDRLRRELPFREQPVAELRYVRRPEVHEAHAANHTRDVADRVGVALTRRRRSVPCREKRWTDLFAARYRDADLSPSSWEGGPASASSSAGSGT
jgi:hypothetical protein